MSDIKGDRWEKDERWSKLISAARKAMHFAYTPYSDFKVGAALQTNTAQIITGCNIENASYGLTNCAERTMLFKAYSEGERQFEAMVVIADADEPISPCGACRQVMLELCPGNMPVLLMNLKGAFLYTTVEQMLPNGFTGVPPTNRICPI